MKDFKNILAEFDKYLTQKEIFFEGVLIGGAAMHLLGHNQRVTKDCDILSPKISNELKEASKEFAKAHGLSEDWLNNGPASLIQDLPLEWMNNVILLYTGKSLKLFTLSRTDFLRSKLFAFLDRGIDLVDLKQLAPTKAEIEDLRQWLQERDGNPDWPAYVDIRLAELVKELYGDS